MIWFIYWRNGKVTLEKFDTYLLGNGVRLREIDNPPILILRHSRVFDMYMTLVSHFFISITWALWNKPIWFIPRLYRCLLYLFSNSILFIAFKFVRNVCTVIFENTESTLPQLQAIEGQTIFSLELQLKIKLFIPVY